ncbi:MAG: hypothetical protein ACOYL3_25320 [Desulfuromonadaceae bacterium]
MNKLVISLTGKVQASNFDVWKKELISLIKATHITLITDDDFYRATKNVDSFKLAEKNLKEAKQTAISQVEEIQKLFAAIDEISAEARQTRLLLERQIKTRKLEIKADYIQYGIDSVQSFIENQYEEFRYADISRFVDRTRFEKAVYGKASTSGVQTAIDTLMKQIKSEVSVKAIERAHNKARIDSLSDEYKLLFQDWKTLIDVSGKQLESEIQERISKFNTLLERKEGEQAESDLISAIINDDVAEKKEKFHIIIEIASSLHKAKELARTIRDSYGNNPSICMIKLVPCLYI